LLGTEPVNQPDQWLATIGTAVHSWLADAYIEANRGVVPARYHVEHRVEVAEGLAGNVDLYDAERKLVLDWKVVGDTSLKRSKAHGPGDQYRTQIHLYGLGFRNKGHEVDHVGIAFLPRGGSLRGLHIHVEPFDESVALAGIERLNAAKQFVDLLGNKAIEQLPGTEAFCHFCPFYLPASTDLQVGCPGGDKTTS
jgi:hypothetical protein